MREREKTRKSIKENVSHSADPECELQRSVALLGRGVRVSARSEHSVWERPCFMSKSPWFQGTSTPGGAQSEARMTPKAVTGSKWSPKEDLEVA